MRPSIHAKLDDILTRMDAFDESRINRASNGRFASKSGASAAAAGAPVAAKSASQKIQSKKPSKPESAAIPALAKVTRIKTSRASDHHSFSLPENKGQLNAEVEGGVLKVRDSIVDPKHQGQGLGKQLYVSAIDYARKRGLGFASDRSVSPDAERVWESLKRQGYNVQQSQYLRRDARGHLASGVGPVFTIGAEDLKKGASGNTPRAANGPLMPAPAPRAASASQAAAAIARMRQPHVKVAQLLTAAGHKPLSEKEQQSAALYAEMGRSPEETAKEILRDRAARKTGTIAPEVDAEEPRGPRKPPALPAAELDHFRRQIGGTATATLGALMRQYQKDPAKAAQAQAIREELKDRFRVMSGRSDPAEAEARHKAAIRSIRETGPGAPRQRVKTANSIAENPAERTPEEHAIALERAEGNERVARRGFTQNPRTESRAALKHAKSQLNKAQGYAGIPEHRRIKVDSRRRSVRSRLDEILRRSDRRLGFAK